MQKYHHDEIDDDKSLAARTSTFCHHRIQLFQSRTKVLTQVTENLIGALIAFMCLEIGETTFSKRDGCSIDSINNVGKIFMDLRSERERDCDDKAVLVSTYLHAMPRHHACMQGSE